jgi:hypothetical protein
VPASGLIFDSGPKITVVKRCHADTGSEIIDGVEISNERETKRELIKTLSRKRFSLQEIK